MQPENIKVRIIETNQVIEFKHDVIKFSDFLRQLQHDIEGELLLSSAVVDPPSIEFIKSFLEGHQYRPESVVVKREKIRQNQERVDSRSLQLFKEISKDDAKMISLIKASDYFRIEKLKTIVLSIWAEEKFNEPVENCLTQRIFGYVSEDDQKPNIKEEYREFFEAISDKLYRLAMNNQKQ